MYAKAENSEEFDNHALAYNMAYFHYLFVQLAFRAKRIHTRKNLQIL